MKRHCCVTTLKNCTVQPRPEGSLLSCAGNIGTPGQAQRYSGFEWLCKHNRLRPEPIRFVRLDFEHAQSDGKSVNRGLGLDQRSRSPSLTKRIASSGKEIVFSCAGMVFNYRCGKRGHCLEYDHDGLAQVVVGVFVACKFITMICYFLSWFFCRRLQTTKEIKDVNNGDVNKEGEGECDGEKGAGAREKELSFNVETAM